jgi:serine/threonine protein kinase
LVKTKQYHLADLLDTYENIITRCTLIEQVSQSVDFIPKTHITIKDDILLYEQEFIQKKSSRLISIDKKYQLLNEFASNLDSLQSFNFVHGDINSSNVLYDGKKLNLIDLEPSFRQRKFGKKIVTSAVPLRSLYDIKNKNISVETDKIGYYLYGIRFVDKAIQFPNKRELSKQRKQGMEFLPIQEQLFLQLSFKNIYTKFIKPNQKVC